MRASDPGRINAPRRGRGRGYTIRGQLAPDEFVPTVPRCAGVPEGDQVPRVLIALRGEGIQLNKLSLSRGPYRAVVAAEAAPLR